MGKNIRDFGKICNTQFKWGNGGIILLSEWKSGNDTTEYREAVV